MKKSEFKSCLGGAVINFWQGLSFSIFEFCDFAKLEHLEQMVAPKRRSIKMCELIHASLSVLSSIGGTCTKLIIGLANVQRVNFQ